MMETNFTRGGATHTLLVIAAVFIILAGLKTAANLLVPFLLSIFIAIICNPLVSKITKFKVHKSIAVIAVIMLFVIVALSLAGLVGKSLNELSGLMPQYRMQLKGQLVWLTTQLANFNIHISASIVAEHFDPSAAMGLAADMLSGLGNVMANLFLIIITVVFMLFEANSVPKKLHLALDDPQMRMKQIDQFLASVNHYLAIKTMTSIATGVLVSLMLYVAGVDFFLLWGVLAFLLNYIPNIGSIIAAVPAILLALIQLGSGVAGAIAIGYVVINTVMGNIIEPKYMGRGLGLSTLVVFLSLVFWGWLLGTVGMLLSVPLTMITKIALESSGGGQWLAILLSSEENV